MLALSLLALGLLAEVAPASCQQGSTGQGYLGCREGRAGAWAAGEGGQGHGLQGGEGRGMGCKEERAGWKTVAEVGWDGGLRYRVLEGEQHTGPQSS